MLKAWEGMATVAVRDIEAARKFYEGTLGLKLVHSEGEEAHTYEAGKSRLLVYRSQYAGTNKATAVTWAVGADVERVAGDLEARGVSFEQYDMPGMTRQRNVHSGDGMKVAWFKDPDGNIHALVND